MPHSRRYVSNDLKQTFPLLMVQNFTQNEMIMAIYHELPSEDMAELENKLESNQEIENNFEIFSVIKEKLNELRAEPSDFVVEQILNYSKSYKK